MMSWAEIRRAATVTGGAASYALAWEALGHFHILGRAWPTLSSILRFTASADTAKTLLAAIGQTAREAAIGYVIGTCAAVMLALFTIVCHRLASGVHRLLAIANALPAIILGPLLMATVPRADAPIALSALVVTFGIFLALVSGLQAASSSHLDLFEALGASRATRLARLQAPAALPYLMDGLKLAAPTALLGAILAEWFGADRGIGPIFVAAMQNYQIELLWSAALVCAAASMAAYGALSFVQKLVLERFA